ncbi:MAG: hypothetical protein ACT4OO_09195 [Nitrospiraceae bacterium]
MTKPWRRHARRARGAAKKEGILAQDVDRPTERRAPRLAAETQRPGSSQRRVGGWSRSLHE